MSTDDAEGDRPEIAEVAPDDFLSTWGASTYEEALERAEQAPTTSDDVKRCPRCDSQRVYPRGTAGSAGPPREYNSEYVCTNCRHHFDDPVFVDEDDDEGEGGSEDGPEDDEDTEPGPDGFVWLTEDDLAEPPLARQLAALDDETLTALAIYCYQPWDHTEADPSYRDLGRIFPYSRDWVGERVREWKDGEHREKVPDPRPSLTADADAEGVAAE